MARRARAALADMRAMEEQAERMNPINPKKALAGAGATPSMGLSQFRGGAMADSDSEDECVGAGKMLAEHLGKMHGGAYMEKFMRGMGKAMLGHDGHGVRKGGMNTGAYEGEGKLEITHHVGAGNVTGPGFEAVGGKKRRAPAAPSDARRKRGAVVSHLMKTKGMSLGEASKHIKAHPELLE
jgi:hypothetical protein